MSCRETSFNASVTRKSSRLFHLKPIHTGRSDGECLTSYITRLSNNHSLHPYSLIAAEILPLLQKTCLTANGKHIHDATGTNWWKKTSVTLNSLNPLTNEWISILESLTQYPDLRFLTMLPYKGLISSRGLIRKTSAWCPSCYEERRTAKRTIYDPLLWKLDIITVCTKHERKLQLHCPFADCGKPLLAISPRAQIGFCPHCNRWLGNILKKEDDIPDLFTLEEQKSILGSVGELLAAAPSLETRIRQENIALIIDKYIEQVLDGNVQALADRVKMHRKSICQLRDGTQLPQLSTLLKLCRLFGITPLKLLTKELSNITFETDQRVVTVSPTKVRKRYRKFDKQSLRLALERQIAKNENSPNTPPPPMSEIARGLGYNQSHLYRHIPDLCQKLSEQYLFHRESQAAQRRERLCQKVRQAVEHLHEQGIYPSQREIGKLVGRGVFKDESVRAARYETLRELGYRC